MAQSQRITSGKMNSAVGEGECWMSGEPYPSTRESRTAVRAISENRKDRP
jgi:hypothetical protein